MITPSFGLTATERVLPKLALDFTTANLDPRVTFTRSGNTATVTNSSGYVVPINANLPRFDFDPITLACKGLLIEESRSNICLQSQTFNETVWDKMRASVVTDATTSPGGTANASKLVESTATGEHYISQTITTAANTIYTFSIFVKAAEITSIRLRVYSSPTLTNNILADFTTLATNPTPVVAGFAVSYGATSTNFGNGWYRLTLSFNLGGIDTSLLARCLFIKGGTTNYTGNGVDGAFIWGAQLETGAFATSYIPTTTTSLTRNADVATMTGTNFSDWYNQTQGAINIEFQKPTAPVASSFIRAYEISDGTTSNRMRVMLGATSTDVFDATSGGSSAGFCDVGAYTTNSVTKITGAYKTDSFAAAQNGTGLTTDTSGTISWTMTQVVFGGNATGGGSYINGWVRKFFYYPQRLTNSEVAAFSK